MPTLDSLYILSEAALKHLGVAGYPLSRETLDRAARLGIKTLGYFEGVLDRLVRNLYNNYIDQMQFVQIFEDLITGQLTRAWMEGMRANGLTEADMTPDIQSQLDNVIQGEYGSISDFADAIVHASSDTSQPAGEGLDAMLSRADLWTNRYNDVVNQATLMTADAAQRMVWRLGNTEEHCGTCSALDGIVATVAAWVESGYKPQSPPNGMLECGGWRCDCRLEPTDAPATEGGIPNV